MSTPAPRVHLALTELRDLLASLRLPLRVEGATIAASERDGLVRQLDDYILPRYESLDAPLLAVVGGSTGAGKSTVVNSLLGIRVAASSAIRPTTRRPLLVHHPDDEDWFTGARILPGFPRVRISPDAAPTPAIGSSQQELEIRATSRLMRGLALLDAPDIDSVVDENRATANQLLAAADLWLFVTTAARYADAVPWELLREAATRDIVVGVVLNRVPEDDMADVEKDLVSRLEQAGLDTAPLFTIPEIPLPGGLIPGEYVGPIREWLGGLATDANARSAVIRRTLAGAVSSAMDRVDGVADAAADQARAVNHLESEVNRARGEALRRVEKAAGDGSLLRGEVLARWQEFVGTAEWFSKLQEGIGRLRDMVADFVRGRPRQTEQVEAAVEDSLLLLLHAEARQAVNDIDHAWRFEGGGGSALLGSALAGLPDDETLRAEISGQVVGWQRDVLTLVRNEGADRRTKARALSTGVNALGLTLIIGIFASTGGLTGAEVATAGGTAAASQALLVAVFGEDAVRRMATTARERLNDRAQAVLAWYLGPFYAAIDSLDVEVEAAERLRSAVDEIRRAEPGVPA
ncbi:MAG TPA: dynamin family protein [Actinomycetaceae bacterium]|nr:dynamin family protein [Actinomycetaceae bacterium]